MRRREDEPGMNMTPMIDVVFQLIIFFVITADLQNKDLDFAFRLAMAPHGTPVEKVNPLTININVDEKGTVTIGRVPLTTAQLTAILRASVAQYGQRIPIVIRGDRMSRHESVRAIMDACTTAGLWRIKFAAYKEEAR
jgi:biopolymer transport protein ExbD